MITENLSTLKIHKLTQEQYDRELANGRIDENAMYLTPDEEIDLSPYATVEQLNGKADAAHSHDNQYYTEAEIDTKLDKKAPTSHASSANTYGAGSSSNYGHVKLSDSTSSTSGVSGGIAATPAAVKEVADAKVDKVDGKGLSTNDYTTAEKTKLSGIEAGAQKNTVTGVKGNSESTYRTGNINITPANIGLGNVNNTSDANKPVSTAQQTAIDSALSSAKSYTDGKMSALLDGATDTTLDSIKELADAIKENDTAIGALNNIASGKANASHTHGNITNAGAIGTAANKAVITTTNGVLTTGTVPVASGGTGATDAATARTNLGITPANIGAAASSHTHDDRYYTESEIDSKVSTLNSAISGKAASEHTHSISEVASLQSTLDTKVDKVSGKGLSTNDYTTAEKNKLAGIASGAEVNQNAFSNVVVGSTTIAADTKTDTLTIAAGSNVTITTDATNDKITIGVPTADGSTAGATIVYPAASCTTFSSDSGTVTPLAVQKGAKMFAITRPSSSTEHAVVRYTNATGDVENSKIIIEDVTNTRDTSKTANVLAIPAEGGKKMVYGYCTDQVDGTSFIGGVFDASATSYPYNAGLAIGGTTGNLLWKGNRVIDAGCIGDYANKTTVDSALSSTSTNPVQNKVINSALAGKASTSAATTSAAGLMSAADKTKLDGIATGANKYSLPTASSSTLGGVKTGSNITNSSGTISLTSANVTTALGYTPATATHNHVSEVINPECIEMTPSSSSVNYGGYIDFHYNQSTEDCTSRIIEGSKGVVSLNSYPIITRSNIIALYSVSVDFTNGKATYTNSNIKANSTVIVQARVGSVNGYPVVLGTTSYNGYVDIFSSSTSENVARQLNIIIITW